MDRTDLDLEQLHHGVRTSKQTAQSGLVGMTFIWLITTVLLLPEDPAANALVAASQAVVGLVTWVVWAIGLLGAFGGGFGWRWAAIRLYRIRSEAGFVRYALGPGTADVFLLVAVIVACLSGVHLWRLG